MKKPALVTMLVVICSTLLLVGNSHASGIEFYSDNNPYGHPDTGDGAVLVYNPNTGTQTRSFATNFLSNSGVTPIPEPTMLGIGLAGLAGAEVRRRLKKESV